MYIEYKINLPACEMHFKDKKKKKKLLKIDPHLKFYRMQFRKNEFEPQRRAKTLGRNWMKKIKHDQYKLWLPS